MTRVGRDEKEVKPKLIKIESKGIFNLHTGRGIPFSGDIVIST